MKKINSLFFMIFLIILGCSRYHDTVAPVKLPSQSNNMVVFGKGMKVTAQVITDNEVAGFDIQGAKVIPVRVTINNESKDTGIIAGSQCFLIDNDDNAWPLLSYEKAVNRIKEHVLIGESVAGAAKPSILGGLLGAVGGLAIGILTNEDIAESTGKGAAVGAAAGAVIGGVTKYSDTENKVATDISSKHIRDKQILPNMLTYGFLYFPGECKSPKELILAIEIDGKLQIRKMKLNY